VRCGAGSASPSVRATAAAPAAGAQAGTPSALLISLGVVLSVCAVGLLAGAAYAGGFLPRLPCGGARGHKPQPPPQQQHREALMVPMLEAAAAGAEVAVRNPAASRRPDAATETSMLVGNA
jgi:hypothetical protein